MRDNAGSNPMFYSHTHTVTTRNSVLLVYRLVYLILQQAFTEKLLQYSQVTVKASQPFMTSTIALHSPLVSVLQTPSLSFETCHSLNPSLGPHIAF